MELTLYQLLCLLGVPSLTSVLCYFYKRIKAYETMQKNLEEKQKEEIETLKLGVQALLRGTMINDFNYWNEKKYAPIYVRDNFENCWKWYEALGENGVMDDIHNRFMALPTSQPSEEYKEN